jgi:hypothetical protein
MTVIVLALVGLLVVVVTIAPPDRGSKNGSRASITPTAAPARTPLTDPDSFDVTATLSTAPGSASKTVDAEVGDRVVIVVKGDDADSVALGDLEVSAVEPGSPARFELLADTPGTYPLVALNDNRRIGALEIH